MANASTPRSASASTPARLVPLLRQGRQTNRCRGGLSRCLSFRRSPKSANRQANSVTVREEVLSTQTRPAASANASAVTASTSSPALAAAAFRAVVTGGLAPRPVSITGTAQHVAPKPVSSGNGMLIVAVDAGHGGKDQRGGPGGTHEKNVTLAVARELARLINRQPGMKAIMTGW